MDKNKDIIKTIKRKHESIIIQNNLDDGLLYELEDASMKDYSATIYSFDDVFKLYLHEDAEAHHHYKTFEAAEHDAVEFILKRRDEIDNGINLNDGEF